MCLSGAKIEVSLVPPQIVLFEGSETSERSELLRDSRGRFLSMLVIGNTSHAHAGVYTCQPASAPSANVTVHVLNGAVMAVSDGKHFLVGEKGIVGTTVAWKSENDLYLKSKRCQ